MVKAIVVLNLHLHVNGGIVLCSCLMFSARYRNILLIRAQGTRARFCSCCFAHYRCGEGLRVLIVNQVLEALFARQLCSRTSCPLYRTNR